MTDTPFATLPASPAVSGLPSAADGLDQFDVGAVETTPVETTPIDTTPIDTTPVEKRMPLEKTADIERIDGA